MNTKIFLKSFVSYYFLGILYTLFFLSYEYNLFNVRTAAAAGMDSAYVAALSLSFGGVLLLAILNISSIIIFLIKVGEWFFLELQNNRPRKIKIMLSIIGIIVILCMIIYFNQVVNSTGYLIELENNAPYFLIPAFVAAILSAGIDSTKDLKNRDPKKQDILVNLIITTTKLTACALLLCSIIPLAMSTINQINEDTCNNYSCVTGLAKLRNDVSYCYKLGEKTNARYFCISSFAAYTKDLALCNELKGTTEYPNCLYVVNNRLKN